MKIHILGICGTFMGGVALLARELGHEVTGSDMHVYPPMSTQLERSGIELYHGYDAKFLETRPDVVIIGNTLSRGNEAVECVLNEGMPYTSGAQWLSDHVLPGKHVLAVSGTHGKTTTTSMLSWVLECADLKPGFLIGGVAENFGLSARVGGGDFFVVEADEYDTAFFDKRSKFIHYRPRTLMINNIEFDHADIFSDMEDILREFRRLVRTVPGRGRIIHKAGDPQIAKVLEAGCWSSSVSFGVADGEWSVAGENRDFSRFDVVHGGAVAAPVQWGLIGRHNAENALAALAAAHHVGIDAAVSARALGSFKSVKRRLQRLAEVRGITVYDDFAHHPTAIKATLSALRSRVGDGRIFAVFEPRSNTMKLGVHRFTLAGSFDDADRVLAFRPAGLSWDLDQAFIGIGQRYQAFTDTSKIIAALERQLEKGDHVVIMSNGGFEGIHERLIRALEATV